MTCDLKGKEVLVVGLARSGVAAANFLVNRGARVTVTDIKPREQLLSEIAQLQKPVRYSLGGHEVSDFLGSDVIILSPGVPNTLSALAEARRQGIPIWSEIELGFRFLHGNVIGITGSNGKTTTTTLIGEMLRNSRRKYLVAGNIGRPLIASVTPRPNSVATTYVLELSSFQLETVERFKCGIAVVLNTTPDHLDRYPSFADYAAAKKRIFRNQTQADFAVLNADDPVASKMAEHCLARCVFFSRRRSLPEGAFVEGRKLVMQWQGRHYSLLDVSEIRLPGNHNIENVLAAVTVAFLSKLPIEAMVRTLRDFAGVEHRLEFVAEIANVAFYNDSKATNVEAAAMAIGSFDRPLLLIMGGLDKGGDFARLRPLLAEKVRRVYLIGQSAERIQEALGEETETLRVASLEEAILEAFHDAESGDVVLLSPGCASFDMFRDFEERGRIFKEAVHGLGQEKTPQ